MHDSKDLGEDGDAAKGTEQDVLHRALGTASSNQDELSPLESESLLRINQKLEYQQSLPKQQQRLLEHQRSRIKELSDAFDELPTETQLIKEILGLLRNPKSAENQLLEALEQLQELVEPIDNANDLQPLGGIDPLLALLERPSPSPRLQEAVAYVLGTAASNNVKFQEHLMERNNGTIVWHLLQMAGSHDEGASNMGLYALGNLLRNSEPAKEAFRLAGGPTVLISGLQPGGASLRAQRKAVSLLTDLMEASGWTPNEREAAGFLAAILSLLETNQANLDMQEKALLGLKALFDSGQYAQLLAQSNAGEVLRRVTASLELDISDDEPSIPLEPFEVDTFKASLLQLGMGLRMQANHATDAHPPEPHSRTGGMVAA